VATVTLISLIGLGLGVVALIVTLALLEGFQSNIRQDLVARAAHARLSSAAGQWLDDPEELASELQNRLPDVEVVAVVRGNCLIASATDAVPASLIGRSDASQVSVDQVLAPRLRLGVGEEVDIVSARRRLTPLGPIPLRKRVQVDRIVVPRPGEEGGAMYAPLELVQRVLRGTDHVDALELRTDRDPWRLGDDVKAVVAGRPDIRVEGVDELNRSLLLALSLERIMIFGAVGLILVVASLNLLCNVAMVAAEKRRDLAVLAGMGLEPIRLRRLFLILGLGIGAAGSIGGALVGVCVSLLLDATGALPLPRGVFAISSVPFRVDPAMVAIVVVSAFLLAALASWLPSRVIARRQPAEGFRYE
jgi:lipoprotein-releasing system permease protein